MKYRKGYKLQLAEDYEIQTNISLEQDDFISFVTISADGILTIKQGYAWDGASGPTIDTKNCIRGSLVHDALYQLMREGVVSRGWRHYVDNLFREILIEDGMFKWRAKLWTWMVKKFAHRSSTEAGIRPILEAP